MARRLTEKQLDCLRSYRAHEINRGRPRGNLDNDPQSEALRKRGMVYVDGCVLEPGLAALAEDDRERALRERMARAQAETRAIVATGKCPLCGSKLRRNSALTGWWQCEQLGAEQFRARAAEPACSWQGFTE